MLKRIGFSKMHSLGNDFVVISTHNQEGNALVNLVKEDKIRLLADRKHGIGFDQLLMLSSSNDSNSDFDYRIFNADGKEVGQCVNGARCAHWFLKYHRLTDKSSLILKTATTTIKTLSIDNAHIQAIVSSPCLGDSVRFDNFYFFKLNLGNPHAVCLHSPTDLTKATINRVGKALNERDKAGVNVSFARIDEDKRLLLTVYERGVGITLACGSGALATAITAINRGLVGNPVTVSMAGGDLLCGVEESGLGWLQGEVNHVFDGRISVADY